MADFTIKQHDTWPPLDATLSDADGPLNLTGATVKLILQNLTGTVTIEGACTIVSAAAGTVRYTWSDTDTDVVNTYNGEFEITWSTGKVSTIPNEGYFTVGVVPDLG